MSEDEGDGLRVFAFEKLCQLERVGFLQGIQLADAQLLQPGHFLQKIVGVGIPKGLDQQAFGKVQSTLGYIVLRHRQATRTLPESPEQLAGEILPISAISRVTVSTSLSGR